MAQYCSSLYWVYSTGRVQDGHGAGMVRFTPIWARIRGHIMKSLAPALSLTAALFGVQVLFAAQLAIAAPVTCTASNNPAAPTPQLPGCILVPNSAPSTAWIIPVQFGDIPGENSPNGEQIMTLFFGADSTFTPANGATRFSIISAESAETLLPRSDLITITTAGTASTPAGGVSVQFTSDPPPPPILGTTVIGSEDPITGFVGLLDGVIIHQTDGTTYTVTVASDGEFFFDPFGFGADVSDGIRVNLIPEPASLGLLGIALVGLSWVRRRG
jgi:hypothetical protein